MSSHNTPPPPATPGLSDDLDQWLKEQLQSIKALEAEGRSLKLNFVQNAREKGDLLIAVEQRLRGSPLNFRQWIVRDTDIGYSTALLWMDVALHYDVVKDRFADSNPLELTVRGIRDAIRDHRQTQGGGKPGSGRKAASEGTAAEASAPTAGDPADPSGEGEASDPGDGAVSNTIRREPDVSLGATQAAEPVHGGTPVFAPALGRVTVVVTVYSDSDQAVVREALAGWSPVTKSLGGSKHLGTLSATAPSRDIDTVMAKLAGALTQILHHKATVKIDL